MTSNNSDPQAQPSIDNIYKLDGRVPLGQAIPFGFQHVLAMFMANVTPIILIAGIARYQGAGFTPTDTATLVQASMLVAGIGTLIQLYPLWKIGARLPIVMGLSFTYLGSAMAFAGRDYGLMIGAAVVGGCLEGILGLTARYWRRFVSPIVSASVVISIGISLLETGMYSFAGGSAPDAGSWPHIAIALTTLLICIVFFRLVKGVWKQLYVLAGLLAGYTAAVIFTLSGVCSLVDFTAMQNTIDKLGPVALPQLFHFTPQFEWGAVISISLISLVSAAETIGDATAICQGGLKRDITEQELSGSISCDGFMSAVSSGVFGCLPITSFSQNVGLITMTKIVNRFTIMCGSIILLLAGLFPPIGAFLATTPSCVVGGCTVMMFGAIIVTGIEMAAQCGFSQRNAQIIAISLCIGIGATEVPNLFKCMPDLIRDIFAHNSVAGVFVTAMFLSLVIPKDNG